MLDERFRSLKTTRAPNLWPDIEHREPRPPRREVPWGRLGTAAVAFAVAAAGIALATRAFLGDRPESTERPAFTPTPPTEPPGSPRMVRAIHVGRAMAVEGGFGSAWVTVFEGRGAVRLVRVDAATGEVTQITRLPIPGPAIGETGLEVGAGSVWLATRRETAEGPAATVIRFDPATNEMESLSSVQGAVATDVVVHDGVVWVPVEGQSGARLIGFDLGTGQTIPILLPEGHPRSVFASGGSIWVRMQRDQAEPTGYFVLTKVDPSAEEVVATLPIGEWLFETASDKAIWAARGRSEVHPPLVMLDPVTARVVGEPIPAPRTYFGGVIEAGHGGIWFAGTDPDTKEGVIGWLNPFTGKVEASVDLGKGGPIVGVDVTPGAVWVIRNDGSLTQIDPT
jgi:hypothetical protein